MDFYSDSERLQSDIDVKGLLISEVKFLYGTNWIILVVRELE